MRSLKEAPESYVLAKLSHARSLGAWMRTQRVAVKCALLEAHDGAADISGLPWPWPQPWPQQFPASSILQAVSTYPTHHSLVSCGANSWQSELIRAAISK
jgi:hypothetical protein